MAFSRAAALRSSFRSVRASRPTIARPQLLRQLTRRGYSSGHQEVKSGGEITWAVGAVAVTIPTCYYLLTSIDSGEHGHDEHGEGHSGEHEKEHEEEHEEEHDEDAKAKDGETEDNSEEKTKEKSDESEDAESGDEKETDTPDTSDDESQDESKDEGKNTKKHIPDAKGGAKKRIESNNSINLGDNGPESNHDDAPKDQASPSKPSGGPNTQSGKQEGLSNTDTKHSSTPTEMSEKADGQPETAKSKGTVDTKRPAV